MELYLHSPFDYLWSGAWLRRRRALSYTRAGLVEKFRHYLQAHSDQKKKKIKLLKICSIYLVTLAFKSPAVGYFCIVYCYFMKLYQKFRLYSVELDMVGRP